MKINYSFLIPIFIGIAVFEQTAGHQLLYFGNIDWLLTIGDTATHYLGGNIFKNDIWRWPIGSNPNYGIEYASSIFFSDSIPLFAVIFKIFKNYLPFLSQYTGLWILICFILQAYLSYDLIKKYITSDVLICSFSSILFCLAPPLLWRLSGHYQMLAQWLILWGISLSLSQNSYFKNYLQWVFLLALASSIHAYLFAFNFIMWIACLANEGFFNRLNTFKKNFLKVLITFGVLIFILWQIGFLPLKVSHLGGGYGIHRLNLLSPINPQGYLNHASDKWSILLPSLSQGAGDYEGFNYFGLGFLFLIATCLLLKFYKGNKFVSKLRIPKTLLISMAFFTIFAITNKIGIGSYTFEIYFPNFIVKVFNSMRASGRFFWPVYYLLLFYFIYLAYQNLSRNLVAIVLFLVVCLQIIDIRGGWLQYQAKFHTTNNVLEARLGSKDLDQIALQYKYIRQLPAGNALDGWDEIAFFAMKNGKPVDTMYSARGQFPLYAENTIKTLDEFKSGNYAIDSLYFLDETYKDFVLKTMKKNDYLFTFNGYIIFAPNYIGKNRKFNDLGRTAL